MIGNKLQAAKREIETGLDWKERTRRSDLANIIAREAEVDREIRALKPFSRIWWRKLDRAGDLRTDRIILESEDPARNPPKEEPMALTERILIRCWRHTKPGDMIVAKIVPYGPDKIAACPKCISEGTRLKEVAGVELSLDAMAEGLQALHPDGPAGPPAPPGPAPASTPYDAREHHPPQGSG